MSALEAGVIQHHQRHDDAQARAAWPRARVLALLALAAPLVLLGVASTGPAPTPRQAAINALSAHVPVGSSVCSHTFDAQRARRI